MICIYIHLHAFASLGGVFSLFSPLNITYSFFCLLLLLPCDPWLPCRLSSLHRARPEALRRPAVLSPLSGCPLVAAVTRPPSGAKRCDSVGRCSVYMSPALSPLAYVLPCVPLPVPWLPSVRPCVCPAAVCRLVVVIAYTPLYPRRRRFGAASAM